MSTTSMGPTAHHFNDVCFVAYLVPVCDYRLFIGRKRFETTPESSERE